MSARKLVYQGMVMGPVILLGFLGLGARAYEDPFEIRHMSERDQALVAAYVEPVRAVIPVAEADDQPMRRCEARRAARLWVALHHAGKLEPLPQVGTGSPMDYSAKFEVSVARLRLLSEVSGSADANLAAGNGRTAAADLILALHLCQINKYGDLELLAGAARRQFHLVRLLKRITDTLDPADRKRIARELLALAHEERQSVDYLARQNGAPLTDGQMRNCVEQAASPRNASGDRSRLRKLTAACFDQGVELSAMRRLAVELGLSARNWPCLAWSNTTVTTVSTALRPAVNGYASIGRPIEAYSVGGY